jgi:hypothetical protein
MPHRVKKPKNVAIVAQFDRLDRAVQYSLHKKLFVAALHSKGWLCMRVTLVQSNWRPSIPRNMQATIRDPQPLKLILSSETRM